MEKSPLSSIQRKFKGNKPILSDNYSGLGKLPPQEIELEQTVLGGLMLEKNALTSVIEFLRPEHFYTPQHQDIFQAIMDLFHSSQPVDLRTVVAQLRKNGKLEFVSGTVYIAELTSKVSSTSNIEYHSRLIIEKAIKRQLIDIASQMQQEAYEDTTDVFELLDKTEQSIFSIADSNLRKNYDSMKSLMSKAVKELQDIKNHKDGLTGVPSGFSKLDRLLGGWQKSDLIIIAARPSMGKTAFVISALRNAAVDHNQAVAIFSLEMSSMQLVNRLISAESELELEQMRRGHLKDYQWQQMVTKTDRLATAPIFIDDTPALSTLELRAKCRRLKQEHNIQLVVVDYLQLMRGDNQGKQGNREQEIASISRTLKNIAKELNIPVVALSQLSRSVEIRGGNKRPQLSDLRESGSIEQDADIVMFLYRPEYYRITETETGVPTNGLAELIIAKNRNGSTETVVIKFISRFAKFTDEIEFSSDSVFGAVTRTSKMNEDNSDNEVGDDDLNSGVLPF